MKKLTVDEIYCLFCRHGHLVNGPAKSFKALYESYLKAKARFGEGSPSAQAWIPLAETALTTKVYDLAEKLSECEKVGVYLNDENLCLCDRCKLNDCRWRNRPERFEDKCPKKKPGHWLEKPIRIM